MKPWLSYRRGSDHRGEFLKLLEGCTTGFSPGGERQGDLVLHLHHVNYKVHKVCRTAFAKAHLRGHDYYDKVLLSCKQRSTLSKNYRLSKTSERTKSMETSPRKNEAPDPTKEWNMYGLKINNEDLTAANMGSTIRQIQACVWMRKFFDLTGVARYIFE